MSAIVASSQSSQRMVGPVLWGVPLEFPLRKREGREVDHIKIGHGGRILSGEG